AGELVVVAGRPNSGTTSFALTLLKNVLTQSRTPAMVVGLEQSRNDLFARLLCCEARVDHLRLLKQSCSAEEMARIEGAAVVLRGAGLFVEDAPRQTVSQIASAATKLKAEQ